MWLMVCYKFSFPEIARTLALQGTKLIIAPTAWVDGDLKRAFSLLTRTRALENTLFLCAYSQIKNIYTGHFSLINPLGIELIKMSKEEDLEFSEINLDEIKEVRKILPCLEQKHKELYGL
ncbi:TPA: hypothetical protein R1711_001236 [Campylobacter lari]|nr:hypothetical protein [Campylobacter lari]